jgi:acyl transferase domain-containing protein
MPPSPKRRSRRQLLNGGLPSAAQSAQSALTPHDSRPGFQGDAVPFLGALCSRGPGEPPTTIVWEQSFSEAELTFLQGHRVGQVMLLPGTCYIEMARAMVRQQHGEACFALTDVEFQSILFLDEAELRGPPTVRLALDAATGRLAVTSRLESGAWDTHATMTVRLCDGAADEAAPLDLAAVRARCPEHVAGESFYAATGNDYRGEFRSLRDGWGGGGGGETLGRIEYLAAEAMRPHLRACAWLDVASHPMVWWMGHLGRGFYAAAVREYRVLRHRVTNNRQLWSVRTATAADGGGSAAAAAEDGAISTLQIYDAAFAPVVRVEGSRAGFFERGWLEGRRAQRHMYYTRWEVATFTDSGCHPSVLLLGSIDTTATPLPTQSTAPLLTGGTEGVLVLLVASRYGLEPLPMLHAALCVITRMATAPAAQLVLLSAQHDTGAPRHTSCHAPHAGLLGLARCARQEVPPTAS